MSNNSQKSNTEEVQLSDLFGSIKKGFENLGYVFYKSILFARKNLVLLLVLFVLGVGLGFILDKNFKVYDNEIIVTPNFGSVDYLYSKIELIDAKIKGNDTVFLKETVGIKKPKLLKSIEITPISDVYRLIENNPEKFELLRLLAENGNIDKIVQDKLTSKNYTLHQIKFTTLHKTSEQETIIPLLKFLNSSEYYQKLQQVFIFNMRDKIAKNDTIIAQIDGILNTFSKEISSNNKSDKLVYYNENSQLNDVIKSKNELLYEQASNRINYFNSDKIIKETSVSINIRNKEGVNGKMKFTLPLLFIGLFIFIRFIKRILRKYSHVATA